MSCKRRSPQAIHITKISFITVRHNWSSTKGSQSMRHRLISSKLKCLRYPVTLDSFHRQSGLINIFKRQFMLNNCCLLAWAWSTCLLSMLKVLWNVIMVESMESNRSFGACSVRLQDSSRSLSNNISFTRIGLLSLEDLNVQSLTDSIIFALN